MILDEYLETIIKNYDPNANPGNSLIVIGESLFKKWDIPIEACLFYGDTISIFKYIVFINFKYEQLNLQLEVNLTHGIKKLKENIEEHLNIHFEYITLKFENKFLDDESKSLTNYGLTEESTIIACDYKIRPEEIYIRSNGKKIKIHVKLKYNTIKEIKTIIQDEVGISSDQQLLKIIGMYLNDDSKTLNYGAKEGSLIKVIDKNVINDYTKSK